MQVISANNYSDKSKNNIPYGKLNTKCSSLKFYYSIESYTSNEGDEKSSEENYFR